MESATGKGVLFVTKSKNESSKRVIPLNQAAREAVERMLNRQTLSATLTHTITFGAQANITSSIP